MLVGGIGCGKSVIMTDKLSNLPDNYTVTNVPFNFYTTSGDYLHTNENVSKKTYLIKMNH